MSSDAAAPQYSPDGHWWWTGTEWVPAQRLARQLGDPTVNPLAPQVAEQSAGEVPPPAQPEPDPEPAAEPATPPRPVFEILPSGLPDAPKKPGALRTALAGSVAAVVLLGAGAAYGVGHYLGGGGQQPEQVLPANAVAVMKVDLDPSLSQKAALFQLSRAFPQVHAKGKDSIKDDLLGAMFRDGSMSYERDIKPWLGDRVAIAAVPGRTGFEPVAAVQYTDKAKAKRTLLTASAKAATTKDPFFFAFSGDYAVIASTQAAADSYAAAPTHLSDNPSYAKAVDSLGGDQIAVAWADIKAVYDGLPAAQRRANPLFAGVKTAPSGAFVIGAHAAAKYLEVQGHAIDVRDSLSTLGAPTFGKAHTANLLATFPADTAAALEVTGLGDTMTKAYRALPPPVAQAAAQFGLKLPGDLGAVLGSDTAIGVLGDLKSGPAFLAHVRTANAARAVAVLNSVAQQGRTPPFTIRRDATGYVLTTDPGASTTGRLGATSSYRNAVPDAKSAGMVVYVNLARLPVPRAQLGSIDAFGMTVDGASGAFRVRLTVR